MPARVTYAEAAEILGCHVSAVPKMVRRGWLHSERRRDGALDRDEVLDLMEARQAKRLARWRKSEPYPDDDHWWISPNGVAEMAGVTPQAIVKRNGRGTLPATRHGHRWWVRYDHVEMIERARLAEATGRP